MGLEFRDLGFRAFRLGLAVCLGCNVGPVGPVTLQDVGFRACQVMFLP